MLNLSRHFSLSCSITLSLSTVQSPLANYIAFLVFSTIVDIVVIVLSVMTTVAAIVDHHEAYRLGRVRSR